MTQPSRPPIRYIAEIEGGKEVTLFGTADLDYWQAHLAPEGLFPCSIDGKAVVLLSAVALRWMGFRFNELSVSVLVSLNQDGSTRDGIFLVSAFNTSRVLAFCERTMFRTPYRHGRIEVSVETPAFFRLNDGQAPLLQAERRDPISPIRHGDECLEGPIFLPARTPGKPGKVFFARLGGETEVYPFASLVDVLEVKPSADYPVLQRLIDSDFAGHEWHIRRNAVHARSKTYNRTGR